MLWYCILSYGIVLLLDMTAAAFFGVTHPSYFGYSIGENANKLQVIKMGRYSGNFAVSHARMMCNRLCAHHADCWSNYVNLVKSHIYCFLVDTNTCQDPSAEVTGEENDGMNYDRIPHMHSPQSCQVDCLQSENGTCETCNRKGCRGSDCTNCDHTCLDCYTNVYPTLPLTREVRCSLWSGNKDLYQFGVTCRGEKFLLFRRSSTEANMALNASLDPVHTFGFSTVQFLFEHTGGNMYIELEASKPNSTVQVFNATYSGFRLSSKRHLWLDRYVDGTAGDGLRVPLSDVSLVTNLSLYDSSCGPFWNISGTYNLTEPTPFGVGPCPGLGTAFWGAPTITATGEFQSGIAWSTLPDYTVTKISVFMF